MMHPKNALRTAKGRVPAALHRESSTYFTDIDLDGDGHQSGFVFFPHSPHEDAWGTVRVPIAVIGNGDGPTVLLEGGNHGDEYEGPIALGELIRTLRSEDINGRLIIVPAINTPAVDAGHRTSPVDGKNMNRVFPGDHAGTITEQIAAFVNDELISRSDALLSLHSGGSSLEIIPSTIVQPSDNADQFERCKLAASRFGAPVCVVMDNLGDSRLCVSSAMSAGLTCVCTEMAGGGRVNIEALELCREGVRDVLAFWGVLEKTSSKERPATTKFYAMTGANAYVLATETGVFEPAVRLGDQVEVGALAGYIHFLSAPHKAPAPLHFKESGIVYSLRQLGTVAPGTSCAVIATPRT
ncbi:succinylglutamate desuccinylase/aspartoacylase family protein [Herbaspirillum sp. 1130]|nr:succinylglutamate desuccinylase/aspartoacylase family protein [Herbaspirillum sp. 1130]MBP1317967.1 putative deacylase [Herbaspirillum sp. 1130]